MARFCTGCGSNIPDGIAFCTECGARISEPAAETVTEAAQPPAQQPKAQQIYQQPPQVIYAAPPPTEKDKSEGVVGTGTFFGTMLLFALPIIGFIACIIMCFAAKKKSLKNYAKATLIWSIIGFVISILLIVAVIALGSSLMGYLNEAMNSGLGGMSGLQ